MGVYLSTPKTEKVSEDGENGRVKYGLSSMQGWRTTMEDAHAAVLDLDGSMSFFGVYDGHGGKEVAKFCAKHLHQELVEHHTYKAGDVATSLQKCFLRMDEMMCEQVGQKELYEMAGTSEKITGMVEEILGSPRSSDIVVQEDGDTGIVEPHADFKGVSAGSTACVTVVKNNQLVVANAGDSRCVLCRNGEAYDLSRDHKPDLEAEKERIVKAGGFIQGGRINGSLNLARAVGDMEFKQNKLLPAEKQIVTANPDVNIVQLSEDDEFFILACDGIWDCMSSQQIVDFVRDKIQSEVKLSSVCEMVFDRCLAPCAGGEGCDNMTMILVQLKKPRSCGSSSEIPMS